MAPFTSDSNADSWRGTMGHSPGLCLTCNNSPTCVYRAMRGYDAIYCETFDAGVPPGGGRPGDKYAAPVGAPSTIAPVESRVTVTRGLCVNCEHRDSCALPRPEGGVWHCEEYG